MEKEFVPYDIALTMKELGFKEKCLRMYVDKKLSPQLDVGQYNQDWDIVSAPLYQQAFRWFREEYDLHGELKMEIPQEGEYDGCYTYVYIIGRVNTYKKVEEKCQEIYPAKEEAQDACLRKLIEIVK